MLTVKTVHTYYGSIHALKGVSLHVREGEMVALIGANGAGKTTTLMSICGITPVRSGAITFDGEDITKLAPNRIVERGISQVPEGRRIFPQLTVTENLDMGAFLRRDSAAVKRDLDEVFSLFPRLAERRHQAGGTLSGGEQQMLAIGRGLVSRPRILLLDEPSLGLAPILVSEIFRVIRKIHEEEGVTILLVEQNARKALGIADYGYILETGRIALHDAAAQLRENEHVKAAYLGGGRLR